MGEIHQMLQQWPSSWWASRCGMGPTVCLGNVGGEVVSGEGGFLHLLLPVPVTVSGYRFRSVR